MIVLGEAYTSRKTNAKTGRMAKHFRCAECGGEFPQADVQIDHIEPVVPPSEGFTTWDKYIERMFCEKEGFQVLCKECHLIKTKKETNERK